jgi:glycosyltransferase involved in cell wall biosynthesis
MKIGYIRGDYPNKRNIIGKIQGLDYIKIHDMYKFLAKAPYLINGLLKRRIFDTNRFLFSFNDFGLNRVDVLHFFNTVSFGKTPWITTFETIVPRFSSVISLHHGENASYRSQQKNKHVLRALQALSNAPCKALIAISENALHIQDHFLSNFPEFHSRIQQKTISLHPPQERTVDNFEDKKIDLKNEIHFLFVGKAFFRKGGLEMLDAMQLLKKRNLPLKLTIISSLLIDNYAAHETEEDVKRARLIISKNRDWIKHYPSLPNHEVIDLMKTMHVGLLPTYADTYGYSVLEFQACGCPVISTNVRALPEINNNKIGWLIDIPKNQLGEAIYTSKEDRAKISGKIKDGLEAIIPSILSDREVIVKKSNAALQKIKDNHSPEQHSKKLHEIYQRALA